MKKRKLVELFYNSKYQVTKFENYQLNLLECRIVGIDLEITGWCINDYGTRHHIGTSLVFNSNIPNHIRMLVEKRRIFEVKFDYVNKKYIVE